MEIKLEFTAMQGIALMVDIQRAFAMNAGFESKILYDILESLEKQIERIIEGYDSVDKELAKRKMFDHLSGLSKNLVIDLKNAPESDLYLNKDFQNRMIAALRHAIRQNIDSLEL